MVQITDNILRLRILNHMQPTIHYADRAVHPTKMQATPIGIPRRQLTTEKY